MALSPWRFQLLAAIVSVHSFVALACIAVIFRDKPLTDWPLEIVSISGVVAVLTTVMKGAMLVPIADTIAQAKWSWFSSEIEGRPLKELEQIDEASRGIWGSLVWCFNHPAPTNVVTLGAVLTVIAGGLDLFSQQIISVDSRQVINETATAYIPWAYNVKEMPDEPSWFAAFYHGFFSDEVEDLPAECSGGTNCVWEKPVYTLGVCGKCADITSLRDDILQGMVCNDEMTICNYTTSPKGQPELKTTLINAPAPGSAIAAMLLPNPLSLSAVNIFGSRMMTEVHDQLGLDKSLLEQGLATISTFEILELPMLAYYTNLSEIPLNAVFGNPLLTQCGFWFCLESHVPPGSDHITSYVPTTHASDQQLLSPAPAAFESDLNNPDGHFYIHPENSGWAIPSREFVVDGNMLTVDIPSISNMFPSNGHYLNRFQDWDKVRDAPSGFLGFHSPLMKRWHDTEDRRDKWVSAVAKSLSNAIRLQNRVLPDDPAYREQAGKAYSEQAYIQVSWPWISLPVVLLIFGLGFFCANIVSTVTRGGGGCGIWFNGLLLLLLSRVDDSLRQRAEGSYATSEELLESIGRRKVRLHGEELDADRPVFSTVRRQQPQGDMNLSG